MQAHKAGAILTGNLVTGNYIAFNGADVAANATPGPTGINVDGGASGVSLSGNTVTGNIIEHEAIDIAVRTEPSTQIDVHLNNLLGGGIGVANQGSGRVNATQNYWGCAGGPGALGCATVAGHVTVSSSLSQQLNLGDSLADPLNPGAAGKTALNPGQSLPNPPNPGQSLPNPPNPGQSLPN